MTDQPETQQPLLRVLNQNATPEEVAAVTAVFASLGGEAPSEPRKRSLWASPADRMRTPHHAGPGAWRASGLPR